MWLNSVSMSFWVHKPPKVERREFTNEHGRTVTRYRLIVWGRNSIKTKSGRQYNRQLVIFRSGKPPWQVAQMDQLPVLIVVEGELITLRAKPELGHEKPFSFISATRLSVIRQPPPTNFVDELIPNSGDEDT